MRVTWTIAGHGAGEALVSTADEAASEVRKALHEAYDDSEALGAARLAFQPLRQHMVTDGASAVRSGNPWERSSGPILVKLWP